MGHSGSVGVSVAAASALAIASCTAGAAATADVTPPPAITSIFPSSGPPGGRTPATITGTGFTGATAVHFGTVPATSFRVRSDSSITARSPAEPMGTVDIIVTTPAGVSAAVPADRFLYLGVCVVPDLSGRRVGGARKALRKAYCKLGAIKPKGYKSGKVVRQSRKPGEVLPARAKVSITLG